MANSPTPLPKKAVGHAFKALLARVTETLEPARMILVLEGSLDRVVLEGLLAKVGIRGRAGSIAREELVGRCVGFFNHKKDFALALMRQLDKASSKERSIVAEWDEESVLGHIQGYQAKDFRRERARMIWALIRDGRDAHLDVANALLDEAFETQKSAKEQQELLAQVASGEVSATEAVASVAKKTSYDLGPKVDEGKKAAAAKLKESISAYETALKEQQERLRKTQSEHAEAEGERSRLIVRLGQRERALKVEEERSAALDSEVKELKREVRRLARELEVAAPERVRALEDERDQLRERVRKLERVIEHQAQTEEVLEENERLRKENDALALELEREQSEREALLEELKGKEAQASERLDRMRSELKAARKKAAGQSDAPASSGTTRVGVFVDAANLSASARREHGGKMDFVGMLPALVGARTRTRALAFVVESADDDGGFQAFTNALQTGGYTVRSKSPKVRSDGSQKADWDMGIAMEILDARAALDVVVLCSGDGDFVPLVKKLRAWGLRVEGASFLHATDHALIRALDAHTDLSGTAFALDPAA